ncbi:hypothetical protein K8R47_00565 [archaeon]|nr:hypothetical protein [archaeon]
MKNKINILEKLDAKIDQIRGLRSNIDLTRSFSDTELRMYNRISENNPFEPDKTWPERNYATYVLYGGGTDYHERTSSSVYKTTTRDHFEKKLDEISKTLRASAEKHRNRYGGADPKFNPSGGEGLLSEAEYHDKEAELYEMMLKESQSTPYTDRIPLKE